LFSSRYPFVLDGRFIVKRRMFSVAVVEIKNVIGNILLGLLFGFVLWLVDTLHFESMKETFNDSVVPAVSGSGHTDHAVMIS